MKQPSKKVTLKGWAITSTAASILWHDKETGYEFWVPLSAASETTKKRITIPEWIYLDRIQKCQRDEKQDERENKREDARAQREMESEPAEIGYTPKRKKKSRTGCGCLLLILIIAAIYAAAKFAHQ